MDTADACHERGIATVAVTAGYIGVDGAARVLREDGRRQRRPEGLHRRLLREALRRAPAAGARHARYLVHETDVWTEITTLLIPGKNDSDAELAAMCEWIARELGPDVPLHFTAFHPDYKMTDLRAHAGGDADAGAGDRARAPGCATSTPATCTTATAAPRTARAARQPLIVRDWHEILRYDVTADGRLHALRDADSGPVRARSIAPPAAGAFRCASRWRSAPATPRYAHAPARRRRFRATIRPLPS